jgi:ribosomal protein L12E/L44/L45/RPP1/RPP2
MTIFKLQNGKVVPIAIVKGGVSTPFTTAEAAPAAPAKEEAKKGDAKPAEPKKEESKKEEKKK